MKRILKIVLSVTALVLVFCCTPPEQGPIVFPNIPAGCFGAIWDTRNTSAGSSAENQVQLPLNSGGTYAFIVHWGDGSMDSISSFDDPDITHTYSEPGMYQIIIEGVIDGFMFSMGGDRFKLLEIRQWGPFGLGVVESQFTGCENLTITATDTPDLSNAATFNRLFQDCNSLTTVSGMNSWDVSGVTSMYHTFRFCHNFNEDISGWNVSNVTTMQQMFQGCYLFDQDLSSWIVSDVTNMEGMFFSAIAFNSDIGGWDVSGVTEMASMFTHAQVFNQDIGGWVISPLVSDMSQMFSYASDFNYDISGWDVSHVTNMYGMFWGAEDFNQDLSGWEVDNVSNMSLMFDQAASFNGDISGWTVSSVTNMNGMFIGANSFDQDLGSWDISGVTDMADMFSSVTLSTANYDAILTSWSGQSVQDDVTFDGGFSQYSPAAAAARQVLEDDHNWTITDGGQVP